MTQQAKHLTLIEQALRELGNPLVREVQSWLKEKHGVDLPLDLVKGNMQIVRSLEDENEEPRP